MLKNASEIEICAAAGWTASDIAVHLGCSVEVVRRRARQLGLTLTREKSNGHVQVRNKLCELLPGSLIREEYHIGGRLRLDFYLPHYHLAIEFDGIQHEQQIKFFHGTDRENFIEAQVRDKTKDQWCHEYGVHLWRICDIDELTSSNLTKALETAAGLSKAPVAKPAKTVPKKTFKLTDEQKQRQRQFRKEQYQKLKRIRDARKQTASSD
jgi:very-short-patch-repair endonuclease